MEKMSLGILIRKTMCGTTEYMPPEIISRKDQTDKVDIWCLGVLLYELTHNKTPFDGQNIHLLQFQQKRHNIQFSSRLNPQLKTIIEKCLEFEPELRPSADEILNFSIFSRFKQENGSNISIKENQSFGTSERVIPQNNQQKSKETNESNRNIEKVYVQNKHTEQNQTYPTMQTQNQTFTNMQNQNQGYTNIQTQNQTLKMYQPSVQQKTSETTFPLKIEPSPKNVIFQNAFFKKKSDSQTSQVEVVNDGKNNYIANRTSGNGTHVIDTRSTSLTKAINEMNNQGNSNTIKVIRSGMSDDKLTGSNNLYNPGENVHSQFGQNLYSPPVNTPQQQVSKITYTNVYHQNDVSKSGHNFYRRPDKIVVTSPMTNSGYNPKVFKYSYNHPESEKIYVPKMSYHLSNNGYSSNTIYADNTIRRVANPEVIRINNNNVQGKIIYASNTDKHRSRSHNEMISPNNITTRIVRR